MLCLSCQHENPEGAKFCNACGAKLEAACPKCGHVNPPGSRFCNECGAALTGKPRKKRGNGETGKRVKGQKGKRKTKDSGLRTPDSKHQTLDARPKDTRRSDGERRQLTVLFCDLVGSTALSAQLDPEEWREVVRAYHTTCDTAISRYEGQVAQHLGDGVLVYFGYPTAHEDDTQRAVQVGLEIVGAIHELFLPGRTRGLSPLSLPHPLQIRIGIHTGLVVVGEIGSSEKREILALGETPNLAARLQGFAEPDTVVISAATHRLVQGFFTCHDLGAHSFKGISDPIQVYHVVGESGAQSRFEVAASIGLTPLVGREHEVRLLLDRWEQVKAGDGQVVLLSGEPGIGKSRLLRVVKEQTIGDAQTWIECRCSPHYQNSAFYPVIDHLQRLLEFRREDSPEEKLRKLEDTLSSYGFELKDTVPLFAALLSLPVERYTPPILTPQRQKQKTLEALVAWLLKEAERGPVQSVWEDLHWADPSTLEFLNLLIDQIPTTRLYLLLTFRPEFRPPWAIRSHLTQITLSRLPRKQAEVMVERVAGDKTLPAEVVQRVIGKTDGVPLFVEELTKAVVETGFVGATHASPLPLAIPATLQDSLMARLDRLGTAKEIAQLGATLGREFSYGLLQVVSPVDETALQKGLSQLVEAELLYQRGLPPQAMYLFKHALIQDAAYQSLLKSTRQQYHQQIAQVLEERFPETKETQPELLAHHCTEAGLIAQAIPYWQQAGQRAAQRSANVEAISHLIEGLELLKALPDTPERAQQELRLQTTLGPALMATKGYAAPEVEKSYARARELCQQVGETPQLFPVLYGLRSFYFVRAELQTAREVGEQLLTLAQRVQDPELLVEAYRSQGATVSHLGEFVPARALLEQGIALYDPQQHRSHAFLYGQDPGVAGLSYTAWVLWHLGYPDQARKGIDEALTLAQELSHPFSLAYALWFAAWLRQLRREGRTAQEKAETAIALSAEQGFPHWLALDTILQGWALAEQGQGEVGIAQMQQGLAAYRATGSQLARPYHLALLAEAYGKVGRAEEGLSVLAEALAQMHRTGERAYEAELYRLKGELSLQSRQVKASQDKSEIPNTQHPTPNTQEEVEREVEGYFQKAIEIARRQQAKSLELRAVMSLVRLRQWQATQYTSRNTEHTTRALLDAARNMLSEIYNWFTEGFDTKDLQEAKTLLEELSRE